MEQHPTEALAAYALDCLDPLELEQVRQHLADCATCRAEVARFEETLSELAHAVPPAEPPAALKTRLLSSLRPGRSFAWFDRLVDRWPRLVPSVALASFALAIVFGVTNLLLVQQRGGLADQEFSNVRLARFQGTAAMPEASGVLLVTADKQQGILVVAAMQPLDQARQYQLWLIKDGQRTSGGVFSVSAAGEARLVVSAEAPLNSYDAFGVTIEPHGGSAGPTGPKVLGGSMAL